MANIGYFHGGIGFRGNLPMEDNYYNIVGMNNAFLAGYNHVEVTITGDSINTKVKVNILNGSQLKEANMTFASIPNTAYYTYTFTAKAKFSNIGGGPFTAQLIDNDPESETFGGVIATTTEKPNIIYGWSPVTIYAYPEAPINTSGTVKINYEGSLYKIEKGTYSFAPAAENGLKTLTYSLLDGDTGLWLVENQKLYTVVNNNHLYSNSLTLTDLGYNKEYLVRFTIEDFASTATFDLRITGEAIFDWNREDFRFFIPVECKQALRIQNDVGIVNKSEEELLAYKTDGNLYLGYHSYNQEKGQTYVCGDNIVLLTNGGLFLGDIDINSLLRSAETAYQMTPLFYNTDINGVVSTFTTNNMSCTIKLMGGSLYVRYRLSHSFGTGDSGAFAGRIRFKHGGKIRSAEYTSSPNISGAVGGLQIKNITVDDEYMEFEVHVCNLAASTNVIMGTFTMPVTLDLTKF